MFLVDKGIPEHITALPRQVMETPFGQMLRPALSNAVIDGSGTPVSQAAALSGSSKIPQSASRVRNLTSVDDMISALSLASDSFAVVFFTSSTCAPCKVLYQPFDELAEEANGKGVFIKVDTNQAQDIAANFGIRSTPTIMSFLKGEKVEEFSGADVMRLRSTVHNVLNSAYPPHQHMKLHAAALVAAGNSPQKYAKIPPLDKLTPKLEGLAKDPVIGEVQTFLDSLKNGIKQGKIAEEDVNAWTNSVRIAIASIGQPCQLLGEVYS
jgi:thiol-disulfide isomerase/thioredoxin